MTGLIDFPEKRALTKVNYLLPLCQILWNITEGNARKVTFNFAFCAHGDVIKYGKTLTSWCMIKKSSDLPQKSSAIFG